MGVATTAQYAGATVGLFLTGLMADYIGLRRTVILVCSANVVLLNVIGWVRSVTVLVVVRCLLGSVSTYALGLSWVAALAPRVRLARWMAAAVCCAQLGVMLGGFIGGALRGRDMAVAGMIVSLPAAASVLVLACARELTASGAAQSSTSMPTIVRGDGGGDGDGGESVSAQQRVAEHHSQPKVSARAGLCRVFRCRYFWGLFLAPLVQGCYIGGVMQSLAPLVLKR